MSGDHVMLVVSTLEELEEALCDELATALDSLEVEGGQVAGRMWGEGLAAGLQVALGHVRAHLGLDR
jgi:hypothetical protein